MAKLIELGRSKTMPDGWLIVLRAIVTSAQNAVGLDMWSGVLSATRMASRMAWQAVEFREASVYKAALMFRVLLVCRTA